LLNTGWKPRHSNDEMFAESHGGFLKHHHKAAEEDGSAHRSMVRQKLPAPLKKFP
jgi:hypothetical protein